MRYRAWFAVTSFFASVGMLLAGLVTRAEAQWSQPDRTLHMGAIAHGITAKGMSGRRDNGAKQEPHGFSYPQGRSLLVYSGGAERFGWNTKAHSAGEGIWVMSKRGGSPHITFVGTNIEDSDIQTLPIDPSKMPEAYLGATHHHEWALAVRNSGGGRAAWTDNINLVNPTTNYWPAKENIAARAVPSGHPALIWNYDWNTYKPGASFADRVASGDLPQLSPPSWAENLSAADFPDIVGISHAKSATTGLQWTRRWMQWGHAEYDDFLLNENVVENTSSEVAEDVYLVIKNRFFSSAANTWYQGGAANSNVPGNRLMADDYTRSTLAPNYLNGGAPLGAVKPAGLARGQALAQQGHGMVYFHDGDQQDPAFPHNDWGDPWISKLAVRVFVTDQTWVKEGYFNHPTYFGLGVVDAFPPFNTYGGADLETYVAPKDNPATPNIDESKQQPASITQWRFTNHGEFEQPDPGKDGNAFIYDQLTKEWGTQNGYQAEPEINDLWTQFASFGPYTLQPGEKFKVVVAYVGGMGSHQPKYSDYKRYAKPFEFAWMNMYDGPGRAAVSHLERAQELPKGEEAMFDHFERAIDVYKKGYQVPNRPANIRLRQQSNLKGQTDVSWSAFGANSKNPDTDASDIKGYRIYRSSTENQGPFELVAEFTIADAQAGRLPANVTYDANGVFATVATSAYPAGIPLKENKLVSGADPTAGAEVKGLYTYTDATSRAGFPNWYHVRYYNEAGLESAPGPGGAAIIGATGGVVPVVPAADVFNRFEERVKVVPNPYRQDEETHSYRGQQNIRFTNLPGRCQIDIYDTTGQRVWTQFNNDLTRGEVTWFMFTENRPSNFGQAVFPGIYFWKVTSLMPESLGQIQKGTLMIVR